MCVNETERQRKREEEREGERKFWQFFLHNKPYSKDFFKTGSF